MPCDFRASSCPRMYETICANCGYPISWHGGGAYAGANPRCWKCGGYMRFSTPTGPGVWICDKCDSVVTCAWDAPNQHWLSKPKKTRHRTKRERKDEFHAQ